MRRRVEFLLLVIFGGLFLAIPGFAKTPIIYLSRPENCEGKYCVVGEYSEKTSVSLLSVESEKVCNIKTGRADTSAVAFSELLQLNKCDTDNINYDFAVFDMSNPKLKRLRGRKMSAAQLKEPAKAMGADPVFVKAVKEAKIFPEGKKTMVLYTVADLRRMESEGFEFDSKDGNIKILRKIFEDGSNTWSYFAFFKGKWSRVASGFTTERRPLVFTFRGRLFLETETTCQNTCDQLTRELYEFNGKNFRKIESK